MSAFTDSGRLDRGEYGDLTGCLRPEADVNSRTASQQPKEAAQMVGFGERSLIACGLTLAPDVSGNWCLG